VDDSPSVGDLTAGCETEGGNVDPQLVTIGAVILVLCVGGLLLSFVLPFLSGVFTLISALFEVGLDVLMGGPVAWCGCLILLILLVGCCGFVAVAASSLTTCGTPEAVNFCSFFGL